MTAAATMNQTQSCESVNLPVNFEDTQSSATKHAEEGEGERTARGQPDERTTNKRIRDDEPPTADPPHKAGSHMEPSTTPVKAFVSGVNALNENMLIKNVLLAGKMVAAHLDTCATHCFISKNMSNRLIKQGYESIESNVEYRVE